MLVFCVLSFGQVPTDVDPHQLLEPYSFWRVFTASAVLCALPSHLLPPLPKQPLTLLTPQICLFWTSCGWGCSVFSLFGVNLFHLVVCIYAALMLFGGLIACSFLVLSNFLQLIRSRPKGCCGCFPNSQTINKSPVTSVCRFLCGHLDK